MSERVIFSCNGDELVGDFYRPEGLETFPAVIVAGPMTSVKEQVTGVYAAALARRGIGALAIDHRGYGQSGGTPRQYENYERKIEDLDAAVDALAQIPGVDADRLGAVGICLGCGYAAHLAVRRPDAIKSLALSVGYYRHPAAMREADPAGYDAKVAQGKAARLHYEETGEVITIPAVALEGDAAMQTPYLFDYYGTPRAGVDNYTNAFAVMSREYFLPFDVQAAAPAIKQPVVMVHSENALSPQMARAFFDRLPGTKEIHWLEGPNQVAFYDDAKLVGAATDIFADHLNSMS